MNAQTQLDVIFDSLNVSDEHLDKINDLKNSFDENHVEVFLEKLEAIDDIDELLESSEESHNCTNQFIDFVSELIISK